MKFTKAFKSNLEAIGQRLDEAVVLLPKLQQTEVDLEKAVGITLEDIEEFGRLTNVLNDILSRVTDVSQRLNNFIDIVSTD